MDSELSIVIFVSISLGFILIVHFVYLLVASNETNQWEQTVGKILHSEIERNEFSTEPDTTYSLKVKYQFTVNNKTYHAKKIYCGDSISVNFPYRLKKRLKKYAEDNMVDVFYNPGNPGESVLEKGINNIIYRELFLGILCIIVGVVCYAYPEGYLGVFIESCQNLFSKYFGKNLT